jgi:hypothetical protein
MIICAGTSPRAFHRRNCKFMRFFSDSDTVLRGDTVLWVIVGGVVACINLSSLNGSENSTSVKRFCGGFGEDDGEVPRGKK